ncbi:hypothetical protein N7494_005346 [Penicillium frequentans]|uniref:Uncharacterized protein n=1 Tax=Penicillium frequentans TaxID=3151616 RepID=A0AAD6GHC3_9EURO|nr:hypothetical protein N7494_005346 [Penicillium glabrum]
MDGQLQETSIGQTRGQGIHRAPVRPVVQPSHRCEETEPKHWLEDQLARLHALSFTPEESRPNLQRVLKDKYYGVEAVLTIVPNPATLAFDRQMVSPVQQQT